MEKTEILYNGACPICAAEIALYRRQSEAAGAPVSFSDLNRADLSGWDLSAEQAARRLHARQGGQVTSGFAAFLLLWEQLPRMRWLARILRLPGLRHLARAGYDWLAAPALHALHRRRQARRSVADRA